MSRILFFVFLGAVVLSGSSVLAQQMVRVRAGEHGEFSRIVFDWDAPVSYSLAKQSGGTLLLTFNRRAALDLSDAASVRLENIGSIQQLSFAGDKTRAQISITPGSRFKHQAVGSKVVLDVFAVQNKEVAPKPASKPEAEDRAHSAVPESGSRPEVEENDPPPSEEGKGDVFEQVPESGPEPERQSEPVQVQEQEQEVAPEAVPETVSENVPEPEPLHAGEVSPDEDSRLYKPNVITVSMTEAVAMAAFGKDGYIWIVLDRPGVSIMPQIAGEQKDMFAPLERFDIEGGTAFRTKVPAGSHIYAEGGGLIWRIVVTPNKREIDPVEVQRRFKAGRGIRKGSLFWLMPEASGVLEFDDPFTGEKIITVPVRTAEEFAGEAMDFVDLAVLESFAGVALAPRNSDVSVNVEGPGVMVSHSEGLALMNEADIISSRAGKKPSGERVEAGHGGSGKSGIYNFASWQMGGDKVLAGNMRVLMAGLSVKDRTGLVEGLMTIAKLNMANGWGFEALGFLELASQYLPPLLESPEFMALRGAAYAMARKFDPAFDDLSVKALDESEEIRLWRAYVLAGLEDWQQAEKTLTSSFALIEEYPPVIKIPVSLGLAEVALRAGQIEKGEQLLELAKNVSGEMNSHQHDSWQYLAGEARRQRGRHEEAQSLWEPLADGFGELYRAKAGLALTEMLLNDKKISSEDAADRLERLRYLWRGDELETRINYRLGKVYLDMGEFTKGLSILRDAASLSPKSRMGRQIAGEMASTFRDLFLSDRYRGLNPIEAITLYEQFPELTPTGSEGDRLVERLAETLVSADLLGRASKILEHQVEHRLKGSEAARVSIRLAAIYLINQEPLKAVASLDRAEEIMSGPYANERRVRKREISLLRARALSQLGKPMEAIAILLEMPVDPDVNRLRADIAWKAGEWDEAAEALEQMIVDAGISPVRTLTSEQAELIMNRAVALNLADNRVALSGLRERYDDQMKNTPRSRIFDILTRPRKSSVLADRETLMSVVSEVDMFDEFLDSYRSESADTP